MAFFDIHGNLLANGFSLTGEEIKTGFDINGVIFNAIDGDPDAPEDQPVENSLTVMSYNVQWWSGMNANEELVASIFDKYNPDIAGFQEYVTTKSLGGVGVGTYLQNRWSNIELADTTTPDNTKAVCSNIELTDATTVYFPVYSMSRSYQKMYIEYAGKKIALFHTHLDYDYQGSPETPKCKQAKELFDAVSNEEYFILFGDLNTCCKSTTDADYINMIKQFVDAGYNCANCSEQFGFFDTWTDGTTLTDGSWEQTDNIITSSNILMNKVVVDTTKIDANAGSVIDHLPLIAYLTIT